MPKNVLKLLLVEDEVADADLFRDMLSELTYPTKVQHVENGAEALKYLRREPPFEKATRPDLVVLDLNMPVMNGYEFLSAVKSAPDLRSIPVMILTTSDNPEDIARCYDGFASGYVLKPGNLREYTQVLEVLHAYWQGLVRLPTIEEVVP